MSGCKTDCHPRFRSVFSQRNRARLKGPPVLSAAKIFFFSDGLRHHHRFSMLSAAKINTLATSEAVKRYAIEEPTLERTACSHAERRRAMSKRIVINRKAHIRVDGRVVLTCSKWLSAPSPIAAITSSVAADMATGVVAVIDGCFLSAEATNARFTIRMITKMPTVIFLPS